MKKKPTSKQIFLLIAVLCALLLFFMELTITRHLVSFLSEDASIDGTANHELVFRVHYLENDFFGSGPVQQDLHYLMSFTDFIEVESSFSAKFSQATEISYEYTATEALLIKYQKGNDRETNPVVYAERTTIDGKHGSYEGEALSFRTGENDTPGGVYTVFPKKHIETYKAFIDAEAKQMEKENVLSARSLEFSAELLAEFTYHIKFAETGASETIRGRLMIPLSDEVFSPEISGAPVTEIVVPLRVFSMPGPKVIVALVLLTVALVAGICFGVYRFRREKHPGRREFASILKKYSDEIVFSDSQVDLMKYQIIEVEEFTELLKLAININKHILCFHNDEKAKFSVIADGFAYCHQLSFEPENEEKKE